MTVKYRHLLSPRVTPWHLWSVFFPLL